MVAFTNAKSEVELLSYEEAYARLGKTVSLVQIADQLDLIIELLTKLITTGVTHG